MNVVTQVREPCVMSVQGPGRRASEGASLGYDPEQDEATVENFFAALHPKWCG